MPAEAEAEADALSWIPVRPSVRPSVRLLAPESSTATRGAAKESEKEGDASIELEIFSMLALSFHRPFDGLSVRWSEFNP